MSRLRNFLTTLFGPRCQHQWQNTGDTYTDSEHGFTVVLKQCRGCGLTLIVEV